MKLTTSRLKKLIIEELQNINEDMSMEKIAEKNMEEIPDEKYKEALKDPKTVKAVQELVKKLGLNKVQEDATKMKEVVKSAVLSSASAGSLFAFNAAFIAGAGVSGSLLVTVGGVGALIGLLAYALGPGSVDIPDAVKDLKN